MRATVFTDRALAKHAGRFVWLSIDTENEKNAGFLEKYPWKAVPTFQVLEPAGGRVAYQWLGAVDAGQLVRRFDEAERALAQAANATGPAKPESADALVLALSMAGENEECVRQALALLPGLPRAAIRANVALTALDCALGAEASAPWREGALLTLEAEVREAITFDGLMSDDRAGLYAALVDARGRLADAPGAKAAAVAFLAFLDDDAKTAPGAEARASLDGYRVSAALAAGAPERALAALQASERDLPGDYNPPARLATVLRELGRYDDALAASDRALGLAYGPRKLNIFDGRATILEKMGDRPGAKAVLEEAVRYAATLPEPQRSKGSIARIEKRLAAM
jgi:tetratricopeptide (TPR) repeat protein